MKICQFLFFSPRVLILLYITKLLYRCEVFTVKNHIYKLFNTIIMINSVSHSKTVCWLFLYVPCMFHGLTAFKQCKCLLRGWEEHNWTPLLLPRRHALGTHCGRVTEPWTRPSLRNPRLDPPAQRVCFLSFLFLSWLYHRRLSIKLL